MKTKTDNVGQKVHMNSKGRPACRQGGLYIVYTTDDKKKVTCNRCRYMLSFREVRR